jgi:phospholipid-binding lipoprotein MlaA
VLEPTARGWDTVLPRPAQTGIDNFFDNLLFPIRFVNHLLQGEIDPAAVTLSRFCVNTTLGVGGLFDPASKMDLPAFRADFGQTLGKWGVPAGPYLVWPLWGSSNVRDTTGLLVDGYLGIQTFFLDLPILLGSTAVNAVNRRSLNLDTVERVREASLDLYSAARNAYGQQRAEMILGVEGARAERDADLYFPDEFDEELP